MSREIYDRVLRKLVAEIPLFAEGILNRSIEKMDATPDNATPFQIKTAIQTYIQPALTKKFKLHKELSDFGTGVIFLDSDGKVMRASPEAYKLIPDLQNRRFITENTINSETIFLNGSPVKIISIPIDTGQGASGHACLVSDITLDRALDDEMKNNYQTLFEQNKKLAAAYDAVSNTEKALKESEQRYAIVARETGQMIYDYNVITGRITWSGAIEELTGYSPANFQPDINKWAGLIHPADRQKALDTLSEAEKKHTKYCCEYRMKVKGNKHRHFRDTGVYLFDSNGKAHRMLGTLMDITDSRKTNEELKNRNTQLEMFNRVAVDREIKMIELKKKIKELENRVTKQDG